MALRAEPARPHDLRGALELLGRSELPQRGVAEGFGHYFVVREDDGRVVAVGGLEVHDAAGLLRSVAVEPAYRGQGLAAALVEAVLGLARRLGLQTVYLLTTTAQGYFARLGFEDCAREAVPAAIRDSWEFRSGCPRTAVLMSRSLG